MSMTTAQRQTLFLDLARTSAGTSAQDVFSEGIARGDDVSVEAYYNLGRRLAHKGLLRAEKTSVRTVYFAKFDENATWLDEEHVAAMIDAEYPLPALTAYRESLRQIREVPEMVWVEARERLLKEDARSLFQTAIESYADTLRGDIDDYVRERANAPNAPHLSKMKRSIEETLALLVRLCKDGIGLSQQAVSLPVSAELAMEAIRHGTSPEHYYDSSVLMEELSRRVEPGALIRVADATEPSTPPVVAGVDGSSVSGLLSLDGANGDFAFGHSPQVSINTATSVLNWAIESQGQRMPAFLRLPEKPEDMQQRDNRYTIMAKMFFPDLTESEFIHSTWNARDLLECRATLGVMGRWSMPPTNAELPPADVIFRDGTIMPHDRDHNHYGQQDTYGRIVRDLIEANWKIAKNCREDGQTVVGVVKNAQLRVFAPIVNFYLCQVSSDSSDTQLNGWALDDMNGLYDQALLTRILTAGRREGDPWYRTAVVLRPFHCGDTSLGRNYSRLPGFLPYEKLIKRSEAAKAKPTLSVTEEDAWWRTLRPAGDPYIQMLKGVWYGCFFLGPFRRLDRGEALSRMEMLIPHPTEEDGNYPAQICNEHMGRLLSALKTVGFDVANEHAMYDAKGTIDLLPSILIRAHDTVKNWAKELRGRVGEYMDWHLSKYLQTNQKRHLHMRPWTRAELEAWMDSMQEERRKIGG